MPPAVFYNPSRPPVTPGQAWGDWSLYTDSPLRALTPAPVAGDFAAGLVSWAHFRGHLWATCCLKMFGNGFTSRDS